MGRCAHPAWIIHFGNTFDVVYRKPPGIVPDEYKITGRVEVFEIMTGEDQGRARVETGKAEKWVPFSFSSLALCNAFAHGWKQEQSGRKFLDVSYLNWT